MRDYYSIMGLLFLRIKDICCKRKKRSKSWYNFNHQIWIEGVLNKIYRAQHKDKNRVSSINELCDKVLNLASDPKEHFNLCLHIIQHQ